jgi:hypothetical protein
LCVSGGRSGWRGSGLLAFVAVDGDFA